MAELKTSAYKPGDQKPVSCMDQMWFVVETIANHLRLLKNPLVEEFLTEYGDLAVTILKTKDQDEGWISE
jgi:hypothetical protein